MEKSTLARAFKGLNKILDFSEKCSIDELRISSEEDLFKNTL